MLTFTHQVALLAIASLTLCSFTSATCSTFTPTGNGSIYTVYNAQDYQQRAQNTRVSEGIYCVNGNHTVTGVDTSFCAAPSCPLEAAGHVTVYAYTNLTLSNNDTAALVALAGETVYNQGQNLTEYFPYERTTSIGTSTFCVDNGTSGYVDWQPYMKCVNGTLDACSAGGTVENGTAVKVCAPMVYWSTVSNPANDMLGGVVSYQQDTVAAVSGMTTDPANATVPTSVGTASVSVSRGYLGVLVLFSSMFGAFLSF